MALGPVSSLRLLHAADQLIHMAEIAATLVTFAGVVWLLLCGNQEQDERRWKQRQVGSMPWQPEAMRSCLVWFQRTKRSTAMKPMEVAAAIIASRCRHISRDCLERWSPNSLAIACDMAVSVEARPLIGLRRY